MMKKIVTRLLVGLGILLIGLFTFIELNWDKTYDAPYPQNIKASTDSSVIARGKYLAFGPAHCADCHAPFSEYARIEAGEEVVMSGGFGLKIPPATLYAPNITPDIETGIGALSDAEIARSLRYMVNHKGKILFPIMPFQELSDEDLIAIISFLRTQEPVKNEMPETNYTFLGKALLTFGVIKAEGPTQEPPKTIKIDSSIAYGKYLAHSVANCNGCHTERDLKSGDFIGEPFGGGTYFEPTELSQFKSFISPNISFDETGILSKWTESDFIARFRAGRIPNQVGSPMPWGVFKRMNDLELKAIYRYLKSVKKVNNTIPQTIFEKGEEVASAN